MTSQSFDVASWVPETTPNVNDVIRVKSVSPLATEFVPYTLGSTVPGPPGPAGPAGPAGPPGTAVGSVGEAPVDGTQYGRQNAAWTPITATGGVTSFNTRTGVVTLTLGDVTTALGYTPYDTANPAGYQTSAQVTASLADYLPLAGGTLAGRLNADLTGGVYFDAANTIGFNQGFPGYLYVYGQTIFTNQVFVQPPAGNAILNVDAGGGANAQLNLQATGGGNSVYSMIGGIAATRMQASTGDALISLERPAGQSAFLLGNTLAVNRWGMALGDASAETGANAGSNFAMTACDDSGANLSIPLAIERATGIATFSSAIVNGPSDRTLKDNIAPLTGALAKVEALQGVSFTMLDTPDKSEIGLIAQDVQMVVPEVIQNYQHFNKETKENEPKLAIDYPKLVALLIESTKELSANVTSLQAEVAELRAR